MSVDIVERHTERSILDLLRVRHSKPHGNGPEWAYLEHVRDSSGFAARRTADALALHLWPSRGHELHGFEVKVSRGDWRRELAKPDKAEGWCQVVDRWWIVAPRGVVPKDELPATWGLLETKADALGVTVQAPLLRPADERMPITRNVLVPMLRAAGAGLTATPEQAALKSAFDEGRALGVQDAEVSGTAYESLYRTQQTQLAAAQGALHEMQEVLGVDLGTWRNDRKRAKAVADALRAVLGADDAAESAERKLGQAADQLEGAAVWLRKHAGRH